MTPEEQKTRAYAGLAYTAFELLISDKPDKALELVGVLARHLMSDAEIRAEDYSGSQMQRLQEEALAFLVGNPIEDR